MFHDMFWEAWNRANDISYGIQSPFYNWTWDDAEFEDIRIAIPVSEMDESSEVCRISEITRCQADYLLLPEVAVQQQGWSTMKEKYQRHQKKHSSVLDILCSTRM